RRVLLRGRARQRHGDAVPPGEVRRRRSRIAGQFRSSSFRMILLPAIDIRDGLCVRLVQGDYAKETVYDEEPVSVSKRYEAEGAEWLHVVDLDAALEGIPRNRAVVEDVIRSIGIPV